MPVSASFRGNVSILSRRFVGALQGLRMPLNGCAVKCPAFRVLHNRKRIYPTISLFHLAYVQSLHTIDTLAPRFFWTFSFAFHQGTGFSALITLPFFIPISRR